MTTYLRRCRVCKGTYKLALFYSLEDQRFALLCFNHDLEKGYVTLTRFVNYMEKVIYYHFEGKGYKRISKELSLSKWRVEQILTQKQLVSGDFLNYVPETIPQKYRPFFGNRFVDESEANEQI